MTKIRVRGLSKSFRVRGREIVAFAGLDFDVSDGEFFVIVGPSGCGKSTLLRILAGLEHQDEGEVFVARRDRDRPTNAMVFQEISIFPWMTVRENVGYGLAMRGIPRRRTDEIVSYWISRVGLAEFERAYPHQLSGGMKQRVSICRAFAADPEVLLMDEPFSALDEQTKLLMQQELLRVWETNRKTVVFITHSVDEALTLGDRIAVMSRRPARIKAFIEVPFPRPRDVLALRTDPRYSHLLLRLWGELREEVTATTE
jgi:NitT/TauT family transport system ATP-binding protein